MDIVEVFIYIAALAGTYHYGLNKFQAYIEEKTYDYIEKISKRWNDFKVDWDDEKSIKQYMAIKKKMDRAYFYNRFLPSLAKNISVILLVILFLMLVQALGYRGDPNYAGHDG